MVGLRAQPGASGIKPLTCRSRGRLGKTNKTDDRTIEHQYILNELKYATHTSSALTYVFDVFIKSLLEMSSRLLVEYDEMRKHHFIDKINVKTSKTMKKANCDVNVGTKVKMPNIVHAW